MTLNHFLSIQPVKHISSVYLQIFCILHTNETDPWLFLNWLTNYMEQIASWQLFKKFSVLYGTRIFIIMFTTIHHLSLYWSQMNSVHAFPSYFFKIHFKITVLFIQVFHWSLHAPKSKSYILFLRLPSQNRPWTSLLPHSWHILHWPPWIRNSNNICWGLKTVNFVSSAVTILLYIYGLIYLLPRAHDEQTGHNLMQNASLIKYFLFFFVQTIVFGKTQLCVHSLFHFFLLL